MPDFLVVGEASCRRGLRTQTGHISTDKQSPSNVQALQLQFQRSLSRGLQVLASYTWSHDIDFGSQSATLVLERGNADFDQILSSLRIEIKIGEVPYRLKTLELQQKLVFSGSIEASVTTLCKFVSSGELSVQGSYEVVTASQA